MGRDYYHILQITRSALDSDIKKAYRKLALNFHPLKNPSDKTIPDKFKDFAEAYDVLSNRKFNLFDLLFLSHSVTFKFKLIEKQFMINSEKKVSKMVYR